MNRSSAVNRPAVFLDRDGTLIEDRGFIGDIDQVVFFPATITALQKLTGAFELFIVTNQRGVADGITPLSSVERVNEYVVRILAEAGIVIRKVYCCVHRREDGCECIKPKPFFLTQAKREFGIDLSRSFAVGDHPHDVELAANAGATGVYVLTGHGEKHRHELKIPCKIAPGIDAAVDYILSQSK